MELDRALDLARQHHAGQYDKAGRPYFGHVCRVVERVKTPDEKLAAAMHDLLEDTDLTANDLLLAGASPAVVEAVVALTRAPGESYDEFCRRAARNGIARSVKLADIADNADEDRLQLLDVELADRLREKYRRAREIVMGPAS
jgi:(p)ppGpp synthase/HD superfamily hydrolase